MELATIKIRVEEPSFSKLPDDTYNWDHYIYGKVNEEIPKDIPEPSGKFGITTHYIAANLYYDIMMERSATCILYLINKPLHWYTTNQTTVETTTYE